MLYCSNPSCPNPFNNPDSNKFCQNCGSRWLSSLFRSRYRVLGLLGEGGFSRTYEAIDCDRMDDPCVIKQFVPQVQGTAALEKATELFKQEAKRLYELGEHFQIPRLIAYFEQDKRLYLVQELVEGQTLLSELNQQGTFSEEKIWQLLADLLPALQFVHEKKVIHRDIKPENIMRRRKDGKLMLIDFGISKEATGTIITQFGTKVGTFGYAPMEQFRGTVYPASDLYSLAVTCIRLLTQCLPKESGSDKLYDALNSRWLWKENLPQGATISSQLEQVLDKLLEDLPKHRYQSADEVLQILEDKNLKRHSLNQSSSRNYTNLCDLLAAGKWREADEETAVLLLKLANKENEGFLKIEDLQNFPCEELDAIDKLWMDYSNKRFGFSIQKQIWQESQSNLEAFGKQVGWCNSQWWLTASWKSYYNLNFDLNAPAGHLPGLSVTIGRQWDGSLWLLRTLFSRVENCQI